MAFFDPKPETFSSLKDTVCVITGGANGIGETTVKALHAQGASIVFGDVAEEAGNALVTTLGADRATFVKTNVCEYADHVRLFKTALEKHGHVDHAIPIAGIATKDAWFTPNLSIEDVETPASDAVVDINLKGTLYFTRVALAYLRHEENIAEGGRQKSLTLVSSASGFLDSPHIPVYSVGKHGLIGLLRALRNTETCPSKVRVNAVCPSFVATAMTKSFAKKWEAQGMPVNSSEYIADLFMGLAAQPGVNGKAVYAAGNKGWDIEEGLQRTKGDWMGEGYAGTLSANRDESMGKVEKKSGEK